MLIREKNFRSFRRQSVEIAFQQGCRLSNGASPLSAWAGKSRSSGPPPSAYRAVTFGTPGAGVPFMRYSHPRDCKRSRARSIVRSDIRRCLAATRCETAAYPASARNRCMTSPAKRSAAAVNCGSPITWECHLNRAALRARRIASDVRLSMLCRPARHSHPRVRGARSWRVVVAGPLLDKGQHGFANG
jgi:hypothetical protein